MYQLVLCVGNIDDQGRIIIVLCLLHFALDGGRGLCLGLYRTVLLIQQFVECTLDAFAPELTLLQSRLHHFARARVSVGRCCLVVSDDGDRVA